MQVTGGTAIHHAAENGHVESIEVLLGGGANMEIKDKVTYLICIIILGFIWLWLTFFGIKSGLTAHDIGSINSHPAVCQLLEQYGYKVKI